MYTIDDIDIFIATHNRADMLQETIECLVNQTIKLPQVTVLDNESTDETEQIVKLYEKDGFRCVKTYTKPGNFLKAQELATKEFCIYIHDDNLIHPQFFERILLGLNSIPNLSGIACSYSFFTNDEQELVKDFFQTGQGLPKSYLIYENWLDFCYNNIHAETYPWPKTSPSTPALLYKTKILKNRVDMTPVYGKADDLDIYKNILEDGTFALLLAPEGIYIRQHGDRDLLKDDNNLTFEQCINWLNIYAEEMNKHTCGNLWVNFWEMVHLMYPILAKKMVYKKYNKEKFCKYLMENHYISDEGIKAYKKYKKGANKSQKVIKPQYKLNLLQRIFSIRNEDIREVNKCKVLHILGIKFILGLLKNR